MKQKVFLISEDTLKSYSLINENLDGKYLSNALQIAQEVDLQNAIGKALYTKIINLVADGSIATDTNYKYLLDNYIQDYLIWQTMSHVQVSVNYKISNSGTYNNTDERKAHIDYDNGMNLVKQYEKYANAYCTQMKDYILRNISKYPEYRMCQDFEYEMDAPLCDIYLADIPSRRYSYWYK